MLGRAQLLLLEVLLEAVRFVLDYPRLALLAWVEGGVDHLLLDQLRDARAVAMIVLLDLDAGLQLRRSGRKNFLFLQF